MLPLGTSRDHVVDAVYAPILRIGLKTPLAERLQHLPLGARLPTLGLAERVDEHVQRSSRGDTRIQLTNRPGRAVARIGEQRESVGGAFVVDPLERRPRQIHLAADFEVWRRVVRQS